MTDSNEQIGNIVIKIFQLNGLLLSWGDRLTHSVGLTAARWQVLGALYLSDTAMTAPQIAYKMGITRQGAQKQLNLLLADGHVEKIMNSMHKRSYHYSLTPLGTQLFSDINTKWQIYAQQWGNLLSLEEINLTEKTLIQLIKIIQKENQ